MLIERDQWSILLLLWWVGRETGARHSFWIEVGIRTVDVFPDDGVVEVWLFRTHFEQIVGNLDRCANWRGAWSEALIQLYMDRPTVQPRQQRGVGGG
jgi:hypothetical protein